MKGYIGPGVLGAQAASGIRYLLDPRVVAGTRWITGADEPGRHVFDLVAGRDFAGDGVIDVAEVREGDPCPACAAAGRDGVLAQARGIEIGHIFQLGRKYAQALDLTVLDENGKQVVVTMGSYGIGVSRAVAAIAEQHHDDRGLVWPREVSPADVHIVATGKDDAVHEAAERLAGDLVDRGLRVLLDDRRGVSPGVKFNDSELIGVPLIVVVGKRLAEGAIEVKDRASGSPCGRVRRRRRGQHRRAGPGAAVTGAGRDGGAAEGGGAAGHRADRGRHLRLGRHAHALARGGPHRVLVRLHLGLRPAPGGVAGPRAVRRRDRGLAGPARQRRGGGGRSPGPGAAQLRHRPGQRPAPRRRWPPTSRGGTRTRSPTRRRLR